MEPLSLAEARRFIPVLNTETVIRVGYHEAAWDIDTDRLIQNFAREVRANGGQVHTAHKVTSIQRRGNGWQVQTPKGAFSARTLVNAAGAWVDDVARMAGIPPIGATPYRRSVGRIPAPGGLDVSGWPMMFGPGESWYAKPDAGKLIVSPADEDPVESHDAWADDMTIAEGIARYQAVVTEPVTRLLATWAGLRTFSPDRSLVLGPDPATPSFVWVACQGGYGFQTSPAASQLVADLIAGRAPELDAATVAALSPARFR